MHSHMLHMSMMTTVPTLSVEQNVLSLLQKKSDVNLLPIHDEQN